MTDAFLVLARYGYAFLANGYCVLFDGRAMGTVHEERTMGTDEVAAEQVLPAGYWGLVTELAIVRGMNPHFRIVAFYVHYLIVEQGRALTVTREGDALRNVFLDMARYKLAEEIVSCQKEEEYETDKYRVEKNVGNVETSQVRVVSLNPDYDVGYVDEQEGRRKHKERKEHEVLYSFALVAEVNLSQAELEGDGDREERGAHEQCLRKTVLCAAKYSCDKDDGKSPVANNQ